MRVGEAPYKYAVAIRCLDGARTCNQIKGWAIGHGVAPRTVGVDRIGDRGDEILQRNFAADAEGHDICPGAVAIEEAVRSRATLRGLRRIGATVAGFSRFKDAVAADRLRANAGRAGTLPV